MIKKKTKVKFLNAELEKIYKNLQNGNDEEKRLHKWIKNAIDDLEKDGFCGVSIPKKLIPKKYSKLVEGYSLWKYDLPSAYRMIYVLENDEIYIYTIILEWFDHKKYNKIFKY
jgi:hypothetical protein